MKHTRRKFLRNTAVGSIGSSLFLAGACKTGNNSIPDRYEILDNVIHSNVFKREWFKEAVIIETLELLRFGNNFICRVRSTDGAEGISVSNNMQMEHLFPIFVNRLQGFFIKKDARDIEQLLDEVYVHLSNYKLQSLALWVPLATIEFAILDMLGKIASVPVGKLFGDFAHSEIAVYQANNYRGKSAEESVKLIRENLETSNAQAIKFKIGGRMNRVESPENRTEKLIPMMREEFGYSITIYADANGSYDVKEAIRIGRILQEYKIDFYEEPVPFDWYEETQSVTRELQIPVAGGEQEASMHNFRWLIANNALDIVQPDIFYFGGIIRSLKVARMAEVVGKQCIPHISGSGLGYLYMVHFVSMLPNAGPFHEFKGFNSEIPFHCPSSDLKVAEGKIKVPVGPGMGIEIDPEFIAKHKVVS